MRRAVLISGIIAGAIVVEGIAFFVSSRVPLKKEASSEQESYASTFDEMLATAERYRDEGDVENALSWGRLALDKAETLQDQAEAAYEMGCLNFDESLRGKYGSLDEARNYLEAAYEDVQDAALKEQIAGKLLDVAEAENNGERFRNYFQMLSAAEKDSAKLVDLWRRNLSFHLKSGGWPEMRGVLSEAEMLPVHSASWDAVLKAMRLRVDQKLLADSDWFDAYATESPDTAPSQLKEQLYERTHKRLLEISETGSEMEQQEALLGLSRLMLSMGDVDAGNEYLQAFLDHNPSDQLTEALVLLSRIARARGEVRNAGKLAQALVRRFDFNKHTADEVLQVVELLEDNQCYDDALKIVEGAIKFSKFESEQLQGLLARAVYLEEIKLSREDALSYMKQLVALNRPDDLARTLAAVVRLNVERSDYKGAEEWILRFIDQLPSGSEASQDVLFSLFDVKFWLNRPPLEQLTVGSAAVQNNPGDPRVALVLLRMAGLVEDMGLYDLAISYYNRIGLLNFIDNEDSQRTDQIDVGEQAMLGKARCLQKSGELVAADHLLRQITNRTSSPLIKSEAAVCWGDLALRFGQAREAERRYSLAHPEMLSASMKARYLLGQARLGRQDEDDFEQVLDLLDGLPEGERREAAFMIFNERFNEVSQHKDQRELMRLIDLALQSEHSDWLPTLSYVLHDLFDEVDPKQIGQLKKRLGEVSEIEEAPLMDLAVTVDKLFEESKTVELYNERKAE